MPTKKDPELVALEKRIAAEIRAAKKQAKQYLPSANLNLADIRKQHNRIAQMLASEVIYGYAALLGSNAYIRQVTHRGDKHSWMGSGETHTTWKVGLFTEIGKYTVLAEKRQAPVALAKALHQSGTILPTKN